MAKNEKDKFLDELTNTDVVQIRKEKNKENSVTTKRTYATRNRKIDSNSIIYFPTDDKDDALITSAKSILNDAELTYNQFYELVGEKLPAYNLVYGLRTRHTVSYGVFERILEIFQLDVNIEVFNKK